MTDTSNFGRHGEMPKPKRPFWRSSFGLLVIYLCIAGVLAASEIGSFIVAVSFISIVGIPIAFVVMAIPTAAIVAITTWVFYRLLRLFGQNSLVLAAVLALFFLAGYPPIHNYFLQSKVDQLVEMDRISPQEAQRPEIKNRVFGVLAYGRRHKCNYLCQRVLLGGKAKTYLVGNTSKNSIEPRFTGTGRAYSLVKRDRCTQEEENENLKWMYYSNKDVAAELAMRAKLENGYCFVTEKDIPMQRADTILYMNSQWGRSAFSASFNPFAQMIAARRLSLFQKSDTGEFEISVQQTLVDYALLGKFIAVVYRGSSGLSLRTDLWRDRKHTYDREVEKHDVLNFIENKVGVSLRLPGFEQSQN